MKPVEWRDGVLRILDQTRLPAEERFMVLRTPEDVAGAIRAMAVRGAPLLGITAAFGLALAANRSDARSAKAWLRDLDRAGRLLVASRPTAVNVAWAVDRVLGAARSDDSAPTPGSGRGTWRVDDARRAVAREAQAIASEDETACLAIARLGAELLPDRANVLTHCNTGALATGGVGTAQGVIVAAHRSGKRIHVWVDETRPVLQGARLTAWELRREGVPMTLVADTVAGSLMAKGSVDAVIVGADRIAANGDVANKVGTYQLAVLAHHHGVPFYVAAPLSTVDFTCPSGLDIVVEERDPEEVLRPSGIPIAPPGTPVANPAFDVTPAGLISALITDRGMARPPDRASIRRLRKVRPGEAAGSGGWEAAS
ncbi:MAG: S-methyl-5-thioribose-1-phosphate isomerase [Actinobacteria bacterium]|nr:MAG: S-methyl-5-thioribose-1-phosphate isomerase [Actinomycetota bacterium]